MTSQINRRAVLAGTTAALVPATAGAGASPHSEIERLFMALVVTLRTACRTADDEARDRLQDRAGALLDALAAIPARTPREIVRKLQAWALVMNVNPAECREGPSPELPMPLACETFASLLEDTQRMGTIPLHGLTYPRRNLPGWKERDKRRA